MNSTDAQTALQQMTQDPRVPQMISVATELGIAALLRDGGGGEAVDGGDWVVMCIGISALPRFELVE